MGNLPAYVDEGHLRKIIQSGLQEDIGPGDVTSLATIPEHTTATGIMTAKEDGVVAGLFVARLVVEEVDPTVLVQWHVEDGDLVSRGTKVGTIRGNARSILQAERLALNFLQRMSGIATLTKRMADELLGSPTRLLDTRKTAPGLRILDKWAVLLGGGLNHRVGLFDMILIKENHISSAGSIENALSRARLAAERHDPPLKIEIEVTSIDELKRVLNHGAAHRVMLDNFVRLNPDGQVDTAGLEAALDVIRTFRTAGTGQPVQIETEASGNVTIETLGAIGRTGVDYVSSGALTHSVKALDLSLVVSIDS
jgi:nicotinate-nucleotide pyrophosphorylase (carboxylating)